MLSISTESPFQPKGGAVVAAPVTENSPLELSGIIEQGEERIFGLFDPVKRQGGWVKLNEPGRDFIVKSYNQGSDSVVVEYQGRSLSLVLKTPKIDSAPVTSFTPPPAQPGRVPVAVGQTPADEAKRLETVAAEVRRRRAIRQAAAQQQGGQPPAAMPQPVPQAPGR